MSTNTESEKTHLIQISSGKVIAVLILAMNLLSALAYVADSHAIDGSVARIESSKNLPVPPINGGESLILELDPPLQFPSFKFTELQIVFVEYPLYIFGINGRLTDNDSASSPIDGTCEWRVQVEVLSCDLRFSNFLLNVSTDIDLIGTVQICSISDAECITSVNTSRGLEVLELKQLRDLAITSILCKEGSHNCITRIRASR